MREAIASRAIMTSRSLICIFHRKRKKQEVLFSKHMLWNGFSLKRIVCVYVESELYGDDIHNAFIGSQRAQPEQVNWANLFHECNALIRVRICCMPFIYAPNHIENAIFTTNACWYDIV